MITTVIFIIELIYKMIPHVFPQFSFNGGDRKIGIYNRKGIPQTEKTMKIRVSVKIASVKMMFKFVVNRRSSVSMGKCYVFGDVKVPCG